MYKSNQKTFSDLHIHSDGSYDGSIPFSSLILLARENNAKYISITDHNNYDALTTFCNENSLSLSEGIHDVDGLRLINGVEVTCMLNSEYSKNPIKIHMLVYGANFDKNSPISRLLNIKHQNDEMVDFGLLKYISNIYGLKISDSAIKAYLIEERKKNEGFTTFGTSSTIKYLNLHNYNIARSQKELREIVSCAPHVLRLNLDAKDLIDISHASGGLCFMAHPRKNLEKVEYKSEVIKELLDLHIDGFELLSNSMDSETYTMIRNVVLNSPSKYKPLFCGGSDVHTKDGILQVGECIFGLIKSEMVKEVVEAVVDLSDHRRGLYTERKPRIYKTMPQDIEDIVFNYFDMYNGIIKNYRENQKNFEKYYVVANRDYKSENSKKGESSISPKDFNSFKSYLQAGVMPTDRAGKEPEDNDVINNVKESGAEPSTIKTLNPEQIEARRIIMELTGDYFEDELCDDVIETTADVFNKTSTDKYLEI